MFFVSLTVDAGNPFESKEEGFRHTQAMPDNAMVDAKYKAASCTSKRI